VFSNFTAGASYALKGFAFIRRPGLRRYFVIPIVLNILLFSALSWYGMSQFSALADRFLPEDAGWWAGALTIIAAVLVGLTVLVVVFFSFTLVLNLIGAPFNDFLAEKVEKTLNHEPLASAGGVRKFMANVFSSIRGELRKYLYFAILGLLVVIASLLLNIVPGLGVLLAPLLSFLYGSWMMALEYLAYPMNNPDIYFPEVRRWARTNKMLSLGFGTMVLLLTITPILNLVVMPAAVAGATLMWTERREFFTTSGVA
jgi:CysZ protein